MKKSICFIALFLVAIVYASCTAGRSGKARTGIVYENVRAVELETKTRIYLRVRQGAYSSGDSLWAAPIDHDLWQVDTVSNAMMVRID